MKRIITFTLAALILAAPMALAAELPIVPAPASYDPQALTNQLLTKLLQNQTRIIEQQGEQIKLLEEQNFILKETYNRQNKGPVVPVPLPE